MRRLITRKVGFAVLGGIACLAAIAVIVIAVALQRAVDKAMAHAVIGGLAECGAHAKATGIDSDGFPKGPVTVAFVNARPDANLVYPGATLLKRSSSREVFCGLYLSRSPAKTDIEFSTPDPVATVNRWYEARLGAGSPLMAVNAFLTEFHGLEKPSVISHTPCSSSNSTSSKPTLATPSSCITLVSHRFALPTAVLTSTVVSA